MSAQIVPFEPARLARLRAEHAQATARLEARMVEILQNLSPADWMTLQNDLYARDPNERKLPAVLADDFAEWFSDHHPVDRETMMAPENMGETHTRFLEEFCEVHAQDPEMANKVGLARAFLLGRSAVSLRDPTLAEAGFIEADRPA